MTGLAARAVLHGWRPLGALPADAAHVSSFGDFLLVLTRANTFTFTSLKGLLREGQARAAASGAGAGSATGAGAGAGTAPAKWGSLRVVAACGDTTWPPTDATIVAMAAAAGKPRRVFAATADGSLWAMQPDLAGREEGKSPIWRAHRLGVGPGAVRSLCCADDRLFVVARAACTQRGNGDGRVVGTAANGADGLWCLCRDVSQAGTAAFGADIEAHQWRRVGEAESVRTRSLYSPLCVASPSLFDCLAQRRCQAFLRHLSRRW